MCQLVVLVDHADAVGKGVLGRADGHRLAVGQNLSLVGEVNAGEHIHQRGLAAAVLSQQGEDLSPVDGQVNAIVGHHLAEAFGDVFEFDCMDSFQGCHPSCDETWVGALRDFPGKDGKEGCVCSPLLGQGHQ